MTAGTFLHAAKLSLASIADYVEAHEQPLPPSARAMARSLGHRRETAWCWCMRVKSALANLPSIVHDVPCVTFRRLPLRPPHPASPPPHPTADPAARDACRPSRWTTLAFLSDAVGLTAFLCAATPMAAAQQLRVPEVWQLSEPANEALADHALSLVLGVHRTVSERWLSRYVGFAAHHGHTDPWRALLQQAPGAFARIRPGGAPGAVLDHQHHPRHRGGAALATLCETLRAGQPLTDAQQQLRDSLAPPGHRAATDSERPTRRVRTRRASPGGSACPRATPRRRRRRGGTP